jgi:hypothetical protein
MAGFEEILLDKNKLIKAFEKLSVTDSMTAKANLLGDENEKGAVESLRTVSPELAAMMAKEGIDISMLSGERKARKKRTLAAEKQKYCHEDGKLKLLVTRAISVAEKSGHEILDFESLNAEDAKIAEQLVADYNA